MSALVLVIEDNPINSELMNYLLVALGYRTVCASDGRRGLEAARTHRPDLILCDVQMPEIDGLEFARIAKGDAVLRTIPLYAVSALAMVGDRERILSAGFDGYIAKPIEAEAFATTVARVLQHVASPSPPAAAAPAATAWPAGAGPTVLVLDDTAENRALKHGLLEPHGWHVLSAADPEEGWRLALQTRPDLIVCDVGLGAGSGFDFIRRVKADPRLRDVPFAFLTATHWDAQAEQEALALGAVAYLRRPMEAHDVLQALQRCLPARPPVPAKP